MFLKRKKRGGSQVQNKRTASPIKHAKHYLHNYLQELQKIMAARPHDAIDAWNQVFRDKYKGMSQAIGFRDHILLVKVYNSSLYALLKQTPQNDLIMSLYQVASHVQIREIQFLLG
ncbi:hypothetical protein CpB0283 [Chlamydia pneumoniae TW-183]|uniref:DUF721 domain-containing protein n=2 Tax=Chlamydia pneumoniae TaxID=83558 RepID=Q9Z8R2_CHLPN|nr:hypothetical protein [Chlamydia pneumoniae]AAD18425.1 CT191 hypothetical protein [Chlamydia pneumoniae CWL029]AAF38313.1 conserved hypothetical protein [Chlamydia pneumoniae AR39]AAP98216.1 hypothetical protein CpB0283 [Chlamydia pneumoniae TW-183]ACZ33251.1 conserved hypothetical protein [Chlamydia pneumoniae LPCoLN]ETR80158.1 Zn-ribbon-containing protein [Chlamydia pneumoniae B21]